MAASVSLCPSLALLLCTAWAVAHSPECALHSLARRAALEGWPGLGRSVQVAGLGWHRQHCEDGGRGEAASVLNRTRRRDLPWGTGHETANTEAK